MCAFGVYLAPNSLPGGLNVLHRCWVYCTGCLTCWRFVAPCCWFPTETLLEAQDPVLELSLVLLQRLHGRAQRLCHSALPTQQGNLMTGTRGHRETFRSGRRKLHSRITAQRVSALGNLCQQSEPLLDLHPWDSHHTCFSRCSHYQCASCVCIYMYICVYVCINMCVYISTAFLPHF